MFENLGFGEILLIAVVMLIFFGPKKLPEIGKSFGKGLSEFKRAMRDVQDSITSEIDKEKK
ncbi:MAG: twin-arginine translocase TatA/TatE family subunit [Bacteroidota bacterium]